MKKRGIWTYDAEWISYERYSYHIGTHRFKREPVSEWVEHLSHKTWEEPMYLEDFISICKELGWCKVKGNEIIDLDPTPVFIKRAC